MFYKVVPRMLLSLMNVFYHPQKTELRNKLSEEIRNAINHPDLPCASVYFALAQDTMLLDK